ncbi:hypothetical protein M407DRAFT_243557 [Tulasnella calospora MUT 4182]|uniref:Uncharacterized protein n=1 Tax=Tulasnella calospora MUT 4182 TaxID=1051891 RepID=A0A0C3LZI5_9AGAM|nr:hypothetical protein M407DRAFT_243557 [Tulasnella calospora MUT 4182]
MNPLSELVQTRFDKFLEDLLRVAGDLSLTPSSTTAKIEIFDTIGVTLCRRRNEHVPFNQTSSALFFEWL